VALGGLWFLWQTKKDVFWTALTVLSLHIYIVSSWFCWYYGASYGHRAFVDAIPFFALCYASLLDGLNPVARRYLLGLTAILIGVQLWLMLKFWLGTIPCDGPTLDHFLQSFFSLKWHG
jgi:hypothetical protein